MKRVYVNTFSLAGLTMFVTGVAVAQSGSSIRQDLIPHPEESQRYIEIFWVAPEGEGPWPAILYVHGHQPSERPGGRIYVDQGVLRRTAELGMVAAAVSQPGYGESDGPPDYSGSRSQQGIEAARAFLRRNPNVMENGVVLYGYRRGAIAAAVVVPRDSLLAGLILRAGAYDVAEQYAQLDDSPNNAGLRHNIEREAGTSEDAFRLRSALFEAAKIRAPTLILHGEDDTTCPPEQAVRLAEVLRESGTPVTLVMFPGVGHSIPNEQRAPHIDTFLKQILALL